MRVVISALSKNYGSKRVVKDLSFEIPEGKVTGFLGPNGSGKTTTMSLMLGLIAGNGRATFDGSPYVSLVQGNRRVGAYLGPENFNPKFTAKQHLALSAFARGVKRSRVTEVLHEVGLASVRNTKIKAFSTGMRQKLGIATALLSQPEILILDEPANGLDPQSVLWLRNTLSDFAKAGGSVFISSHLLSEISQFAEHLVVMAQGELLASEPMDDFLARLTPVAFKVRTTNSEVYAHALAAKGLTCDRVSKDVIEVHATDSRELLEVALQSNSSVMELTPVGSGVEDVFMALTAGLEEYQSGADTRTAGEMEAPHA